MIGRTAAKRIAERVFKHSAADQTEVLILGGEDSLTRFSDNTIHQNVSSSDVHVGIRAVVGKRIGVYETNATGASDLKRAARRAVEIARVQAENPEFKSLPRPQPAACPDTWDEATARCTPLERAKAVEIAVRLAKEHGCIATGAFTVDHGEIAVFNTLGVAQYQPITSARFNTVVLKGGAEGFASASSGRVGDLHVEKLARRAVAKAIRGGDPVALEPGEYTVVLEHAAVATLVDYLAYLGFGAQSVQEGRSFMGGKLGRKITGENISIWDDGADPAGMPLAFDFEGVPKRKVALITNGVARGVVWDSFTAGKERKRSTGHAIPAGDPYGPMPMNLFVKAGRSSINEMIARTRRGVYVTRFHYTNVVEPMKAVLTGMTRSGTFLIENGRITRPVKNLRYTERALAALGRADLISRDRRLHGGFGGAALVPAMRIRRFRFSGVTGD